MKLALACVFLLLGSMCLYVASRPLQASTPWGMYKSILEKMGGA